MLRATNPGTVPTQPKCQKRGGIDDLLDHFLVLRLDYGAAYGDGSVHRQSSPSIPPQGCRARRRNAAMRRHLVCGLCLPPALVSTSRPTPGRAGATTSHLPTLRFWLVPGRRDSARKR